MPNEMTAAEAAEMLEDIAVVSDLKAVDGKRSGVVKIGRVDAENLRIAASYLRKIAAGEYKLVVHGHWINYYEPLCSSPHANCSICSHLQTFNEYCGKIYAPRYCENCGAPMDGKDEEN